MLEILKEIRSDSAIVWTQTARSILSISAIWIFNKSPLSPLFVLSTSFDG